MCDDTRDTRQDQSEGEGRMKFSCRVPAYCEAAQRQLIFV